MKQQLKRIEATLSKIDRTEKPQFPAFGQGNRSHRSAISFTVTKTMPPSAPELDQADAATVALEPELPKLAPGIASPPTATSSSAIARNRSGQPSQQQVSFDVVADDGLAEPHLVNCNLDLDAESSTSSAQAVQTLDLPKFKLPDFSNSRQVTNPEFALGLLKEMHRMVTKWQIQLRQVSAQIQTLYLEGPIIDGWLESHPHEPQHLGAAILRHAEIDRLMEYVEEICKGTSTGEKSTQAEYRLCGLDADGQLWARPCATEKVPEVSLAIARYQKLRQYLAQKQQLENRLNTFVQSLIALRSSLKS